VMTNGDDSRRVGRGFVKDETGGTTKEEEEREEEDDDDDDDDEEVDDADDDESSILRTGFTSMLRYCVELE
jgi:hypothetical protein